MNEPQAREAYAGQPLPFNKDIFDYNNEEGWLLFDVTVRDSDGEVIHDDGCQAKNPTAALIWVISRRLEAITGIVATGPDTGSSRIDVYWYENRWAEADNIVLSVTLKEALALLESDDISLDDVLGPGATKNYLKQQALRTELEGLGL